MLVSGQGHGRAPVIRSDWKCQGWPDFVERVFALSCLRISLTAHF